MLRAKSMAVVGLGVLFFAAVAFPASAGDTEWEVRFGLLYSSPTGDFSDSGQTTELDSATGFHVGAEFGLTDLIGIEAGLGMAKHDITVDEPGFPSLDFGETTWTALTVNGNFHLLRERNFDLYVGPSLGYVLWDDIETDIFMADIPTDDEFAIGVNGGIDVPIGDGSWAFAAALRYLMTDLPVPGGGDIGVDPLQVKIGLSYSF